MSKYQGNVPALRALIDDCTLHAGGTEGATSGAATDQLAAPAPGKKRKRVDFKGALASRSGVGLSSGTHCPSPNACRRCSWPRSRRTARKMRGRAAASASRSSTRRSCRKSPRRGRVDPQDCHAQPRPAREEARPLTLARAAESRVSLRAGELGGGEGGARYAGARGGGTPLAIPGLDPVYRKQD